MVAEFFSWPVVEFVADALDFVVVEAVEGGSLWQVLSDEPVHVLVGIPLPRVVGKGEVVVRAEAFGDGLVPGEFLAVVGHDGVQQPFVGQEHFGGLVCEGLAVLALEQRYPRDARCLVVGREQRPSVVRPHDEVYLEVAATVFVVPNILVYGLHADAFQPIQLAPPDNLLGSPL